VIPGDLLAHAANRARELDPGRAVEVEVDDELATIAVDPVIIEHVIMNLMENALAYTAVGTEVRLVAHRIDDALELRVIDHGPGIPLAEQARVFEEFVRLVDDDRRGMGLGLPIVRAFAAAHGGSVRYEETPGGGATFVVTLPDDDTATAVADENVVVEDGGP
jgi:two-component system sensor histidine kinase KdpD